MRHRRGFGSLKILFKDYAEISVRTDTQTYTITDVDYNNDFKLLKQKLNDENYINNKKVIELQQKLQNNGDFYRINFKKMTIGIYVLKNEAVADLNSIKIIN